MNTKIETVSEDELISSDYEVYTPSPNETNLQVNESAYLTLEHITLEWPSQTIAKIGDEILICTNPEKKKPSIVVFNFDRTENFEKIKNFDHEKVEIDENYNRMRVFEAENRLKNNFCCVSENILSVFNKKFKVYFQKENSFAYGLATTEKSVFCGLKNGKVVEFDVNRNSEVETNLHSGAVESIETHENLLFTASCDKTVKVTDLRTKILVNQFDSKNEINSVSYNKNNFVVFGDDDGLIKLVDLRKPVPEEIEWHKTAISNVLWKNEDVFASCSDEQVVLWDKSFEEEWEFNKYLSFVHQGQKFYKEICFYNDFVFTTSFDGICIFRPVEE